LVEHESLVDRTEMLARASAAAENCLAYLRCLAAIPGSNHCSAAKGSPNFSRWPAPELVQREIYWQRDFRRPHFPPMTRAIHWIAVYQQEAEEVVPGDETDAAAAAKWEASLRQSACP
jgi:hypothetical protein